MFSRFTPQDLTADVRALIADAAQRALDASPATAVRAFNVTLPDGRIIAMKGISAADPVITDGEHFLLIRKKPGGKWLHAGGMIDVVDGKVETAEVAAAREAQEETGMIMDAAKGTVLAPARVNHQDIRFYDPTPDHPVLDAHGKPTGRFVFASHADLKPGDPFIMDGIGVKFLVPDLMRCEIVPKGVPMTAAQKASGALQAADDAHSLLVVHRKEITPDSMLLELHYEFVQRAGGYFLITPSVFDTFWNASILP